MDLHRGQRRWLGSFSTLLPCLSFFPHATSLLSSAPSCGLSCIEALRSWFPEQQQLRTHQKRKEPPESDSGPGLGY